MEGSRKSHQPHQDSDEEVSSSSTSSVEDSHDVRKHPYFESLGVESLSSKVYFPPKYSWKELAVGHYTRKPKAEQSFSEISMYNTRIQRYITKQERICIDSDLCSPAKVTAEIAERLKIEKEFVVFQHSEVRTEESFDDPFVVILPQARSPDTVILILRCHYFDQFIDQKRYCLRIGKKLKVSEVKEIIKTELKWKGVEIYINKSYMSDDRTLEEFDMHDFSQIQAVKSVAKTVTFLHQPTSDIVTRFRMSIYTSDSVKLVKEKFLDRFQSKLTSENGECLHITCSNELLNDEHCFGLTDKFRREDIYQMHFASADVILCILNYQTGKERLRDRERRTILISPACSTAELREEASKHMRVDPKAVKLNIDNKQRIEEMTNVSEANTLYNGCTILAGIKKKKALLVKHPAADKPEKVASLYALEPVSTLRKLIAKRYRINELQIVIKYKGTIMKDSQLLYNYPIKNNMVLELHIFERRLNIVAHVTFRRRRLTLIIDDSEKTTIGEILKYCAGKLQYRSSCSRCVYGGQCLDKDVTLKTAGLTPGCKVNIIYFSEEDQLNGGLKRIFMVDADGRTIPRYGSVAGGLLLHASKKVKLRPTDGEYDEEDTLPEGIHKSKTSRELKVQQATSVATGLVQEATKYSRRKHEVLRRVFHEKARCLLARKYPMERNTLAVSSVQNSGDNDQTEVKSVISGVTLAMQERNNTLQERRHKAEEDNDQTFVKTVLPDISVNSHPSYKEKIDLSKPEFYLGEVESKMPSTETLNVRPQSLDDEERLSELATDGSFKSTCTDHDPNQNCTCETCKKPKDYSSGIKYQYHVQDKDSASANLSFSVTSVKNQNEEKSVDLSCKLGECPDETINLTHTGQGDLNDFRNTQETNISNVSQSANNLHYVNDERTGVARNQVSESLPSNIWNDICLKTFLTRNAVNSNTSSDSGFRIDMVEQESSAGYQLVLLPRQRTESENSNKVSSDTRRCILQCNEQDYKQVNRLLTTSGITIPLIGHVSSEIGNRWKQLARKLEVDEGDIQEIEHRCKSSLYEAAFQSLLQWKKQCGLEASRERLLAALRGIKMNYLAEGCGKFPTGYQTA